MSRQKRTFLSCPPASALERRPTQCLQETLPHPEKGETPRSCREEDCKWGNERSGGGWATGGLQSRPEKECAWAAGGVLRCRSSCVFLLGTRKMPLQAARHRRPRPGQARQRACREPSSAWLCHHRPPAPLRALCRMTEEHWVQSQQAAIGEGWGLRYLQQSCRRRPGHIRRCGCGGSLTCSWVVAGRTG